MVTYILVGLIGLALFALVLLVNLSAGEKKIVYELPHRFSVEDPQFLRCMGQLLGPGILPGNKLQSFQNGSEIFPAMLRAIREARETITFETYIYWSGDIGRSFSDALCERARAGVKVHVMLDWVGCGKMESGYLDAMRVAGVEVEQYHPLRWYNVGRLNNRTHRKLLVVDGRIGFTGGVGIADTWTGCAEDKDHWRDSHFQLEGPAVAQMQASFTDNWIKTRAEVFFGSDYFPELHAVGGSLAQVFKSSRGEGSETVRLMYLLSIASATRTIRLAAAYFVPDQLSIDTLVAARGRGVSVEIIVPGPVCDARIVQSASRALWDPLLQAGVEIFEFQPTMYHCKVLIVDDAWVSVGSTNFDERSFRLNDEANLNVLDPEFAAQLVVVFEHDKAVSHRVIPAEFRNRPRIQKLADQLAALFRRQL